MSRGAPVGTFGLFGLAVALLAFASKGFAQPIEHTAAPCMDTEEFPLIEARASSTESARGIRGLRVRFKAETGPGWYEAFFQPATGTRLRAILPKPLPEASRVVYFIESNAPEFRSPEYTVDVLMGGCPGASGASEIDGDVRVERTAGDQTEFPAGFSTDGIQAGRSMSRVTLGMIAAAGAGAGVAAVVLTGDEAPPVAPPPPDPPGVLRACFTPDPIPDIDSGNTILFDASCTMPATVTTYRWDFGDGQTAMGSSVEHLFRPGGIYTVRLTVSDGQRTDDTSRVVRVRATPVACFTTTPDPPRIGANESINFNGECSVGDRDGGASAITSYQWDFGDGRPGAEGVFVSRQFAEPDIYGVTLTITNEEGRQDATTQFIVVELEVNAQTSPQTSKTSQVDVSFVSRLEFPKGEQEVRAQVSLNDAAVAPASATTPQQFRLNGRVGDNVVEARLLNTSSKPGRWHFDFRNTPNFEPGSLKVEGGDVLALEAKRVVIRVSGQPGTVARFRFTLTN